LFGQLRKSQIRNLLVLKHNPEAPYPLPINGSHLMIYHWECDRIGSAGRTATTRGSLRRRRGKAGCKFKIFHQTRPFYGCRALLSVSPHRRQYLKQLTAKPAVSCGQRYPTLPFLIRPSWRPCPRLVKKQTFRGHKHHLYPLRQGLVTRICRHD
jgi:hypothetical protein